jgi:hypothetical protein
MALNPLIIMAHGVVPDYTGELRYANNHNTNLFLILVLFLDINTLSNNNIRYNH